MQQDPLSCPPAEELASLAVVIIGRVQGVGFRYFAHEVARRLHLTGYVRNLRDGSVGAYAEGRRDRLLEFLRLMREGPGGSRVRDVRTTWGVVTGRYSTFSIEPTL